MKSLMILLVISLLLGCSITHRLIVETEPQEVYGTIEVTGNVPITLPTTINIEEIIDG